MLDDMYIDDVSLMFIALHVGEVFKIMSTVHPHHGVSRSNEIFLCHHTFALPACVYDKENTLLAVRGVLYQFVLHTRI